MTSTIQDLLTNNLITRLAETDRRLLVLERLLRLGASEDVPIVYIRESTTGLLYRLECEIVNGEVSLFLAPVLEGEA